MQDFTKDLIDLLPTHLQEIARSWQNLSYIVLSLFALDVDKMGILVLLLFLDTFFGVIKVITIWGWHYLSGSKFFYGMLKKTLFILIPFILSLIAKGAIVSDVSKIEVWLSIVITILILQQAYSVIANMLSILTKKHIRSKDFASTMLERLMQVIESLADKLKDKLDDLFK